MVFLCFLYKIVQNTTKIAKDKSCDILTSKNIKLSILNPSIKNLTKRRVKDLTELKEKILIFDNSLDDVAVEMVKNAVLEIFKKSYGSDNVKAYFSKLTKDGGIEFALFIGNETAPRYHATKKDIYDNCCEILRSLNYKEPEDFLRVGPTLADELLKKYKND